MGVLCVQWCNTALYLRNFDDVLHASEAPAHDHSLPHDYVICASAAVGCGWAAGLAGDSPPVYSTHQRHGSVAGGDLAVVRGWLCLSHATLVDGQDCVIDRVYPGGCVCAENHPGQTGPYYRRRGCAGAGVCHFPSGYGKTLLSRTAQKKSPAERGECTNCDEVRDVRRVRRPGG